MLIVGSKFQEIIIFSSEFRSSRSSRRSSELSFTINESLELNTMYEYGQNRAKNRRSRPRRREGIKHEWSKKFNKGVQVQK